MARRQIGIKIIKLSSSIPTEATFAVKNIESPSFLINFLASNSELSLKEKQSLLENNSVTKRGFILLEQVRCPSLFHPASKPDLNLSTLPLAFIQADNDPIPIFSLLYCFDNHIWRITRNKR